ncbi:MAG: hypothetical protein ACPG5U_01540 [Planktomarina sp.]
MPQIYKDITASDVSYVPVVGKFTFDAAKGGASMEPTVDENGVYSFPEGQSYQVTFNGLALNSNGFTTDFSTALTVSEGCLASWCGSLQADVLYMAMLQVDDGKYDLAVGACPGSLVWEPTSAQVRQFEQCHKGGRCTDGISNSAN